MIHKCTWRNCGAPATKCVRLSLKNPQYKQLHEDGTITEETAEGKTLWRCDEHYRSCVAAYMNSAVFNIEL